MKTELNGSRSAANNSSQLENHDDFKNLVDLLSVYSEAENRLDHLEASVNEATLEVVDDHRDEYAGLQKTLVESEAALEIIARRHPDWFRAKATLKTPYGSVALKNNPPKLVAPNEEVSIVLIQTKGLHKYLRTRTELNLEALSDLSDASLSEFRITRIQNDTFSVKAAKLDLGKAVKESDPRKN